MNWLRSLFAPAHSDVFLSYRTHDAALVRAIAEALFASQVKTWFAEYSIAPKKRKAFQVAIDDGIDGARFGILFVSAHYVTSVHCQNELGRMLRQLGPERLLEVQLPGFDGTANEHADIRRVQHTSFANTLAEIAHFTSLPVTVPAMHPDEPSKQRSFDFGGDRLSIDVAGWTETSTFGDGYAFSLARGPLTVAARPVSSAFDSRTLDDGTLDDDEYFRKTAVEHVRRLPLGTRMDCVGIHLVRVCGFRHLGFTAACDGSLQRFYVLRFPGGHRQNALEVVARVEGNATDFYRVAFQADRLVHSFTLQTATLPNAQPWPLDAPWINERAAVQASARGGSVDDLTTEYIKHFARNVIGAPGRAGPIDLRLKLDMLFKTYPPELAGAVFFRLPVAIHNAGLDALSDVADGWDPGSRRVAARVMACFLSLAENEQRDFLLNHLPDDARTLVKQASAEVAASPVDGTRTSVRAAVVRDMVCVEAGEFLMGTSKAQAAALGQMFPEWSPEPFEREMPQRSVWLDRFFIDRYPVTNAQYRCFVETTGHPVPFQDELFSRPHNWDRKTKMFPAGKDHHPVVLVSWKDAAAYAKWAGKRLPTEAEWEKAARGTDGRLWPWGNEWDANRCNNGILGSPGPSAVDAYPNGASPYGVFDMAGNVWEWCADGGDIEYHRHTSNRNPVGAGPHRVIRGGCFFDEYPFMYRCSIRDMVDGDAWEMYRGFRCARDG
jgi:formylglycine-generating enzyme required for sulfatase activity